MKKSNQSTDYQKWVKGIHKRFKKSGEPIEIKIESGSSKEFPSEKSLRALALKLKRSPSHICRVINGERQSRRLVAELKKCGIKCRKAI